MTRGFLAAEKAATTAAPSENSVRRLSTASPAPSAVATPAPKRRRLLELDAFRGIASIGVLLFHYYYHVFEVIGPEGREIGLFGYLSNYGQYGVELFFMISGFVIFMTLERTTQVVAFVRSRFARLFPVYWLSILITSAVVHSFGLPGREVSLSHTLINFTMLEEFANVDKVDGAYWTLTLELCFYVLIGAAFFLGALRRFHVCIGVFLAGLGVAQVLRHLTAFELPWKVLTFFLVEYGHLFALGMVLYQIYKHESMVPRLRSGLLLLGCLALAFFHGPLVGSLVIGFTGLFFAFMHGWLRFLAIRPFLFFGTISYSLYIVHQNCGYVMLRELTDAGMAWPLAQVLTCAAAVVVATGMTYFVERPVARWVRNWEERRGPRLV